mgnify:CR=1 FL=1
MKRSISYKDQDFGGTWNAHKNWKKLRDKHRRHKKKGFSGPTKPEIYQSAGKGDVQRSSDVPKEIYELNYQLAFGKITKRQHAAKVNKFWQEHTI